MAPLASRPDTRDRHAFTQLWPVSPAGGRRDPVIQERLRGLRGKWGDSDGADTETLRETQRMYRSFLFQLTHAGRAE